MTAGDLKPGDWVEVRPEHDIPAIVRGGKPTRGRVDHVAEEDGSVWVWVPIGGADVDEHSQAVPYEAHMLTRTEADRA